MAEPKKSKPKAKSKSAAAKADEKPVAKTKRAKPKASKPAAKSGSSAEIYTDPALRDRLKDEITAGDKGGKPGQWSARKAQLLAAEYEKAGGDYKNGKQKKTAEQKHLDQWTDEDWKTSDDKPAEREGGTTRYLPAEAWDQLTPEQKRETNVKKQRGSKAGKQFVANTDDAKAARKSATAAEPAAAAKPKAKAAPRRNAAAKPKAPKGGKKSSK